MRLYGRGITFCSFCRKKIEYAIEGETIYYRGARADKGIVVFHANDIDFYCDASCERAAETHLFDEVLR